MRVQTRTPPRRRGAICRPRSPCDAAAGGGMAPAEPALTHDLPARPNALETPDACSATVRRNSWALTVRGQRGGLRVVAAVSAPMRRDRRRRRLRILRRPLALLLRHAAAPAQRPGRHTARGDTVGTRPRRARDRARPARPRPARRRNDRRRQGLRRPRIRSRRHAPRRRDRAPQPQARTRPGTDDLRHPPADRVDHPDHQRHPRPRTPRRAHPAQPARAHLRPPARSPPASPTSTTSASPGDTSLPTPRDVASLT